MTREWLLFSRAEGERKHSQAKGPGHDDTLQNAENASKEAQTAVFLMEAPHMSPAEAQSVVIVLCPFFIIMEWNMENRKETFCHDYHLEETT